MKYKILTAHDTNMEMANYRLETCINKFLKDGWKLQGGISMQRIGDGIWDTYELAQAVVKED